MMLEWEACGVVPSHLVCSQTGSTLSIRKIAFLPTSNRLRVERHIACGIDKHCLSRWRSKRCPPRRIATSGARKPVVQGENHSQKLTCPCAAAWRDTHPPLLCRNDEEATGPDSHACSVCAASSSKRLPLNHRPLTDQARPAGVCPLGGPGN